MRHESALFFAVVVVFQILIFADSVVDGILTSSVSSISSTEASGEMRGYSSVAYSIADKAGSPAGYVLRHTQQNSLEP
jgi:hypothetical protein